MKIIIILLCFLSPCVAMTQCTDSTKDSNLLFIISSPINTVLLEFNLGGKPQVAFKDEKSGGYAYTLTPKMIVKKKDISFNSVSRLKISAIFQQSVNGICTKIIKLEKGLKLNISTNINCFFNVDSSLIKTPSDIVVSSTDTKTISTTIEEGTYKFDLSIDKLSRAPGQLLEQKESEIKKIIIKTMKMTNIESSFILWKDLKIKNISYQLSN